MVSWGAVDQREKRNGEAMNVAYASYAMLWQRTGGLQVQIRETLNAMNALGCGAKLFDFNKDRLEDFDLLHVFGAINGNERFVEAANDVGLPVLISPVLNPPFTRTQVLAARLATSITGRLTGWQFTCSYEQVRRAVTRADAVVALGPQEVEILRGGFGISEQGIYVIPNGVGEQFFEAQPDLFREETGIDEPFLLQVSSVSPYKNVLASARVASALGIPLVQIGQTSRGNEPYLASCREAAGGRLHYVGALAPGSPLLASAYAGAAALLLPSQSEVMPLVVLEALAAGTPAVMTKHSSLQLAGSESCVITIDPRDGNRLTAAVGELLESRPARETCQALVRPLTWPAVASRLLNVYNRLV